MVVTMFNALLMWAVMKSRVDIIIELSKVRIACLATASAATGFVLAAHGVSFAMLPMLLGVFVLASGAGALNQAQEGDIDALMKRTMNRPIPSGRIRTREGYVIAVALILAGSALLLAAHPVAMLLGFVTILWYNGVYTPLKRVTAFAAIPGGIVGAIPKSSSVTIGRGTRGLPPTWNLQKSMHGSIPTVCLFPL